jgi:hypothetical protein
MSLIYNAIAKYRLLSKKQKIITVAVVTVAALALLQWLG